MYTDVVQCSAVQCLCVWSTSALARYVHLCTRCVGVQWSHQMLIEYAAGLEGECNKCLIHFSSKQCWTLHFVKIVAIMCPVEIQPTCKSDIGTLGIFSEPLILVELGLQCTRSTVHNNVSQYAMLELLVSKFEQKRCNKRKAYWWTKCKQIRFANACNVHSKNMRAKMWPSFSIRWMSLLTEFVRRSRPWS